MRSRAHALRVASLVRGAATAEIGARAAAVASASLVVAAEIAVMAAEMVAEKGASEDALSVLDARSEASSQQRPRQKATTRHMNLRMTQLATVPELRSA